MVEHDISWQMVCDEKTFEKCRNDEAFPYVVALARAVNTLTFIHSSAMHYQVSDSSPAAMRGRLNSYLFGSALLYEALKLIRKMGGTFVGDELYQNGLRLILKDDRAKDIENKHLKPARHGAVFHFDVAAFKKTIDKGVSNQCLFVSARGRSRMETAYSYADIVSAEILVGVPAGNEDFDLLLGNAMRNTSDLVTMFADRAEPLIARYLRGWGFVVMSQPAP